MSHFVPGKKEQAPASNASPPKKAKKNKVSAKTAAPYILPPNCVPVPRDDLEQLQTNHAKLLDQYKVLREREARNAEKMCIKSEPNDDADDSKTAKPARRKVSSKAPGFTPRKSSSEQTNLSDSMGCDVDSAINVDDYDIKVCINMSSRIRHFVCSGLKVYDCGVFSF